MLQLILDGGTSQTIPTASSTGLPTFSYVLASVILLIVILVAFNRLLRSLQRPEMTGLSREKILEMWAEIEKMSGQGIMGAKLAVIEADKLLDNALRSMMFPGETMGERLKMAQYKYPNIQKVWSAHRLRNQLVHDSTFEISPRQAKQALNDFRAGFDTLRLL